MISQIRWHEPAAAIDPFSRINVARWYMEWSNGRKMDAYISAELDRRYAEYKADSKDSRSKAIIDFILQTEIAPDVDVKPEKLDPDFKVFATRQIRLFVFSGHDSLSSTICYIYHSLSKNVEAMRKIMEEHDLVFGRQVDGAGELLKPNHILQMICLTQQLSSRKRFGISAPRQVPDKDIQVLIFMMSRALYVLLTIQSASSTV